MIKNFLFHRVNPQRDKLWDPMDIALFERSVKFISKHYKVVLLEELFNSNEFLSKNKYATIMFDDGYKDNIEFAAPILEKYSCKASFYIVTDCIDKNIPTWTHILEHAFQFTSISEIDLTFSFLPSELKVKKIATSKERLLYVNKLKPFLKKISHEDRNLVLNKISTSFIDIHIPELMMSWGDLSELKNAGHYIGSHTLTHSMLGTMSNDDDIKKELLNSGITIKNKLGYFPLTISYPVGSYNQVTKKISKEVGYKIGLAVKQKIYDPKQDDFFEIPRIELYNEPWWKTRMRITNTLENIKSIIRYK